MTPGVFLTLTATVAVAALTPGPAVTAIVARALADGRRPAMAINAGDALFVISNQAIIDLKNHYPAEIVVQAAEILHNTCLELTRGQFLDMSYEERKDLGVEDYWPMISGKTSALLMAGRSNSSAAGHQRANCPSR